MTYKDNFVVEVKCRGKILRVRDGSVFLPFGSEYSILLKNLNSRKTSVKIHIDGQDILDYSSLILEPNSSTELEGFLSGTIAKNKFKFIKKTKEIQDHRGDKIDDGIIRVEFAFEKSKAEAKVIDEKCNHHHYHYYNYPCWPQFTFSSEGQSGTPDVNRNAIEISAGGISSNDNSSIRSSFCYNVQCESLGVESLGQPLNDEGITVKGSECCQSFRYGSIGDLEQSQVIIISLKGINNTGVEVEKPVTVKDRLECSSCGTKCRSSFKFCPICGTFLE
jgi:hypothetical protein